MKGGCSKVLGVVKCAIWNVAEESAPRVMQLADVRNIVGPLRIAERQRPQIRKRQPTVWLDEVFRRPMISLEAIDSLRIGSRPGSISNYTFVLEKGTAFNKSARDARNYSRSNPAERTPIGCS